MKYFSGSDATNAARSSLGNPKPSTNRQARSRVHDPSHVELDLVPDRALQRSWQRRRDPTHVGGTTVTPANLPYGQ
jgi:hypothetical protein